MTLRYEVKPYKLSISEIQAQQLNWGFDCNYNDYLFIIRQLDKTSAKGRYLIYAPFPEGNLSGEDLKQRIKAIKQLQKRFYMRIKYDREVHDEVALCLGLTRALL